jgi:hypothetical protein
MTNGSGNAEHANVAMQRRDTGGCDAQATKIRVELGCVGSGDLNELSSDVGALLCFLPNVRVLLKKRGNDRRRRRVRKLVSVLVAV